MDAATLIRTQHDLPLEALLGPTVAERLALGRELERLRHAPNRYHRVRACVLLATLYREHLALPAGGGQVPWQSWTALLERDFERGLHELRACLDAAPSPALAEALAVGYRRLAFATLAEQVQDSVRAEPVNRWLFDPSLPDPVSLPTLGSPWQERTPVRMDLTHSSWSDLFFLAMDRPRWARVLNASIALAPRGMAPEPPVRGRVDRLERPVIVLESLDLGEQVELTRLEHVFDFAADHLGLLRAALVASGFVPPHLQEQTGPLAPWLTRRGGGLRLTSWVRDIPKGSRLAVSTSLLGCLISLLQRVTGQSTAAGPLTESERRMTASRAILGEWLGGSGGGWQDSGGLWPGFKRIEGVAAAPGDPEHGHSRGRLLPRHVPVLLKGDARRNLEQSLVLFHGGMAQDVGPILEWVTEDWLARRAGPLAARERSLALYAPIQQALERGDIRALAALTDQHYTGPLREVLPWAANAYADDLRTSVRQVFGEDFWGFWMLGGMAGGGMGIWLSPEARASKLDRLEAVLATVHGRWADRAPFAMAPLVYDMAVDEHGTVAGPARDWPQASAAVLPPTPPRPPGQVDEVRHESLRAQLRTGVLGLAQNRLPTDADIRDVSAAHLVHPRASGVLPPGELAVLTLAAGRGSRWSGGADVVKAISPVGPVDGRWPGFLELQLRQSAVAGVQQHVVTLPRAVSLPTVPGVELTAVVGGPLGRRFVPTCADLRFAFYETQQARGTAQEERVRESGRQALLQWAAAAGEASDYDDEARALHPPGHLFEVPKLLVDGTLLALKRRQPALRTLLVRNVDALGASPDPGVLSAHRAAGTTLSMEVVPRLPTDEGGGLALLEDRPVVLEGLALPQESLALELSWYSSNTSWLELDPFLAALGLTWDDLAHPRRPQEAVRAFAAQLPAYAVLKEVRRALGGGHEDHLPVLQVEQLWGDVTRVLDTTFIAVQRARGEQLKQPADRQRWWNGPAAALALRRARSQ